MQIYNQVAFSNYALIDGNPAGVTFSGSPRF